VLTTSDAPDGASTLNPDNRYPGWQQQVAARCVLRLGLYRPGRHASRIACPLLVLACEDDRSALPGPAVRAARAAPRGELVRLTGGHYEPFMGGHEQAAEAQLSFLQRHWSTAPDQACANSDAWGLSPREVGGQPRSGWLPPAPPFSGRRAMVLDGGLLPVGCSG
jgi:hypothetical protein